MIKNDINNEHLYNTNYLRINIIYLAASANIDIFFDTSFGRNTLQVLNTFYYYNKK